MKLQLPKAYSSRGAAMGRPNNAGPADLAYKFRLQRLAVDAGGYDEGGAQWGLGNPLFMAWDDETAGRRVDLFFRAESREAAREIVLKSYPAARFFRQGGGLISVQKKPNPLEAAIALVGKPGEPSIPIGKVPFHVLHVEDGRALLAGVLLDHSGQRIGKVEIEGFPAGDLPAPKPVGAPRKDEKRLAILLAWSLKCAESGGKMGIADEQIVESGWFRTGCSAADKVRKIRNDLAKEKGLDLDKDALHVLDDSDKEHPPPLSVLIEKATVYATETGGFEIAGLGVAWLPGMGERVSARRAIQITVEQPSLDFGKTRGGPIIISIIRPGR